MQIKKQMNTIGYQWTVQMEKQMSGSWWMAAMFIIAFIKQ